MNADEMSGLPAFADQAAFSAWAAEQQAKYSASRDAHFTETVRPYNEHAHAGRPR